ncbi:HEPN domain-containing protein [Pseudomonas sp. o96-267]|uniref:ApeA N-terminal domain 1-containing protein n=1 Tax=Pseudomonas sp. o96-267 TaxID=2479853 RepID=UPI000F7A3DD9|nr:HEPN domain-containing protein [Pseudomonas sp. o96-267]
MKELIRKETGLFWWHIEEIPEGQYAPQKSISGTLEIDANGLIELDLNGMLSEKGLASAILGHMKDEKPKEIQGILKGSGEYILLKNIYRNGGHYSAGGISHEKFIARSCLISTKKFSKKQKPVFNFEVTLSDLEEWTNNKSIAIKRNNRKLYTEYCPPKDKKYKTSEGSLLVKYDMTAPWNTRKSRNVTLHEKIKIELKSTKSQTLEWVDKNHTKLEGLLIILIGQNISLEWPTVCIGKERTRCEYIYHRQKESPEPPKFHEIAVPFTTIRDNFGNIFENWRISHDIFGPGFYLFLGTIRSKKSYIENKFVNLIWGLESLHRKLTTKPQNDKALEDKIQRIINEVRNSTNLNRSDRKWLTKRLEREVEITLNQRLKDIFSELPIIIDDVELNTFCTECANRRNDISHFGGNRGERSYDDFINEIKIKTAAILHLYHAAILLKIGVEKERISWWIMDGFKSYEIKSILEEAGLKKISRYEN